MNGRIEKKLHKRKLENEAFCTWLDDYRSALMETLGDQISSVEVITQQFKRKYTRARRYNNRQFQVTRMRTYLSWMLGECYGRECLR